MQKEIITILLLFLLINSLSGCSTSVKENYNVEISRGDIHFHSDKVVIDLPKGYNWSYHLGNSMKPSINEDTITILLPVKKDTEISIGDIVTFKISQSQIIFFGLKSPKIYCKYINCSNSLYYAHRVVKKGVDDKGEYFITKGDNNILQKEKILRKDIAYITKMIIY